MTPVCTRASGRMVGHALMKVDVEDWRVVDCIRCTDIKR